eukprot:COSAG05_NODE_801_length_7224_cov_4.552000_14_plen_73_part_00
MSPWSVAAAAPPPPDACASASCCLSVCSEHHRTQTSVEIARMWYNLVISPPKGILGFMMPQKFWDVAEISVV